MFSEGFEIIFWPMFVVLTETDVAPACSAISCQQRPKLRLASSRFALAELVFQFQFQFALMHVRHGDLLTVVTTRATLTLCMTRV